MQVIGIKASLEAIDAIAERSSRPEVAQWLSRVLKKKIKTDRSLCNEITKRAQMETAMEADDFTEEVKDRIRAAAAGGDQIFSPSRDRIAALFTKAADTLDWFESLPNDDRRIRRINRMAWDDAERLSDDWHKRLANARKKTASLTKGVKPIYQLSEGAFIAELTEKSALRSEGSHMGHCVGGYWERVASGETRILSLRDVNWNPHVTIELNAAPKITFADGGEMVVSHKPRNGVDYVGEAVQNWTAVQIRGKENKPPVAKYKSMLNKFLQASGIPHNERLSHYHGLGQDRDESRDIIVYTVLRTHFFSCGEACRFGAGEVLRELEDSRKDFDQIYAQSGLKAIHMGVGQSNLVDDFFETCLPRVLNDFKVRLMDGANVQTAMKKSGLNTILSHYEGDLSRLKAAKAELSSIVLGLDAEGATSDVVTLLRTPCGGTVEMVKHQVPLLSLYMLSNGVTIGDDALVLADIRQKLSAVFDQCLETPGRVHTISSSIGGIKSDTILQGALICGLAAEFQGAMDAVGNGVRRHVRDLNTRLKKMRSSVEINREQVNYALNVLSDGYEKRLVDMAKEKGTMVKGVSPLVMAAKELNARPTPGRPAQDEPAIRQYRMPR